VEQSGAKAVFRGNHTAKIDDKGRLKIPNAFRSLIEKEHGSELFVTSLTGDEVRIYPMPVWVALEQRLAQMPSTHPARLRFLDRVNYFGQMAEIDAQGRVVIPARLRESAELARLSRYSPRRFRIKAQPQINPDSADESPGGFPNQRSSAFIRG
jgi:MraZ protein